MCPRFPEPVPLEHPIPVLMEALDKVRPPSPSQVVSVWIPDQNCLMLKNKFDNYYKYDLLQVDALLRTNIDATKLPAISAIVIFNDSVLWNGNFGRRNGSDPTSPPVNEYTIYRWVIMALHTYDLMIMLHLLLLQGLGVFHD